MSIKGVNACKVHETVTQVLSAIEAFSIVELLITTSQAHRG